MTYQKMSHPSLNKGSLESTTTETLANIIPRRVSPSIKAFSSAAPSERFTISSSSWRATVPAAADYIEREKKRRAISSSLGTKPASKS